MKITVKKSLFIIAMAVAAIYAGCTKGPDIKKYTYPAPEPQGIFPDSGYANLDLVTITGSTFGDYKNAVKVFFNGVIADSVLSCEDGKIVVKVPGGALSGKVSLQVWTNTVDSIGNFTVKPNPVITSVSDSAGVPGDQLQIAGAHFGSDLSKVSVSFNGTPATVNDVKDSLVSVTVPASFKPGNITLTVENYNITGPGFGILVAIPTPSYALDFESNLVDRISGVAATYNKGTAADLSYEPGKRGLAVRFPGFTPTTWNNSGTVSPTNLNVFKLKEFTVTCWINWASGRDIYPDPIFEFGEARDSRIAFLTRMGSGTNSWNGTARKTVVRYLLNKTPVTSWENYFAATGAPILPTNVWKHMAFVFSYSQQYMKIYIDGTEVGTKTFDRTDADPLLMTIKKISIGGAAFGSGTETNYAGLMDNFRIYSQALSAEQIYTDFYKK